MTDLEPAGTLLRSQLECPICGDLIASIHVHDFQTCSCGQLSIDGGRDYLRVAYGDKIGPSLDDPERWRAMNKSISIAGEHNKTSAGAALEIYKALWAASDHGASLVPATAVLRTIQARGNHMKLFIKGVRAYLKLFTEGENAPVEGSDRGFRPLVPLAERPDAP